MRELIHAGAALRYRSLTGEVYDAVMIGEGRRPGLVSIDVKMPGPIASFRLEYVLWSDVPTADVATAWPKGESA